MKFMIKLLHILLSLIYIFKNTKMEHKQIKVTEKTNNQVNADTLETAYNDTITFRSELVTENSQFINKEADKMERFKAQITSILSHIGKKRKVCEEKINQLEDQIKDLQTNIEKHRKEVSQDHEEARLKEQINELRQQYIGVCKERIDLAQKIDMKKLKNLEIEDRKSKAHEVFKWIIVALYEESENKYYWPNFCKEALDKDKGNDLRERLGKINASKAKEEQKIKTEFFLNNFEEIRSMPELKGVKDEVRLIFRIAQQFKQGYIAHAKIKNHESAIQAHKEKETEKADEFMRWRAKAQALSDRIESYHRFYKVLGQIEKDLLPKAGLYEKKHKQAAALSEEFLKFEQWKPTINKEVQQTGQCECLIF